MGIWNIVSIIALVVGLVVVGLYFLNRKASRKLVEQQDIIDKNKQTQAIFVIDKKKDYLKNINMPKAVLEQANILIKARKAYFVQAKIGPQIMTLMCDKKVFEAIPLKKNVKVDIVGIYILGLSGGKTKNPKSGKKTVGDKELQEEKTGVIGKIKSALKK